MVALIKLLRWIFLKTVNYIIINNVENQSEGQQVKLVQGEVAVQETGQRARSQSESLEQSKSA